MRIHFLPVYWNPIRRGWTPMPEGFEVQVFDEDIGFHDRVGCAVTTGGMISAEVSEWGPEGEPEFFFRIPTRGRRIDLLDGRALDQGEAGAGPLLMLPDPMWDSRKDGPNELLRMQDWLHGKGHEDDPFIVRLEAGGAFFRAVYWNAIALGPSMAKGAHRPLPAGVTFHLADPSGRTVGRGCSAADGLVYVPIWESGLTAVSLRLDADYKEPLIIDLESEQVAGSAARAGGGRYLTITSWEQGTPVLCPQGVQPPFVPLVGGWAGTPAEPIEVDISAEPWTHGNRVQTLVDGDETFRAIVEAMKTAERTIHICSWDFDPRVWVDRLSGSTVTLEDVLLDLVGSRPDLHVRVLNWPNPTPLGMKADKATKARIDADPRNADGRFAIRADSPGPITRSHHQKLITIDDRIGFCGGVDFAWGRWDTGDHAVCAHRQKGDPEAFEEGDLAWQPWHDVHCRLDGPVVSTLVHNFRTRWRHVTWEDLGRAVPLPPLADGVPALAARTWPASVKGGDDPVEDELAIKNLLLRQVGAARSGIVIEQQYLFSRRMAKALAARLRQARASLDERFRMVILLPHAYLEPKGATPKMAFMQESCTGLLRAADPDGRHLRLLTLRTWDPDRADYASIYIHAKVMLVDDEWLTIGSANMGNRSLGYDTEFNVAVADPEAARDLRLRLWREHARGDLPEGDAAAQADHLVALARDNQRAWDRYKKDGDLAALGADPSARRVFPYRTEGDKVQLPIPDFLL